MSERMFWVCFALFLLLVGPSACKQVRDCVNGGTHACAEMDRDGDLSSDKYGN